MFNDTVVTDSSSQAARMRRAPRAAAWDAWPTGRPNDQPPPTNTTPGPAANRKWQRGKRREWAGVRRHSRCLAVVARARATVHEANPQSALKVGRPPLALPVTEPVRSERRSGHSRETGWDGDRSHSNVSMGLPCWLRPRWTAPFAVRGRLDVQIVGCGPSF